MDSSTILLIVNKKTDIKQISTSFPMSKIFKILSFLSNLPAIWNLLFNMEYENNRDTSNYLCSILINSVLLLDRGEEGHITLF